MKNFIEIGKTEEEQVEQIKQWIKENGMQIVIGVAIGLSAIWGWDYYQDYQSKQAIKARMSYLLTVSNANNTEALADLQTNHANSAYAQQGALVAAKHALDADNAQSALDYLLPLLNAENKFIAHIARLRLSRVYLEMGNYDQALSVIDQVQTSAFSGLYDNIKGDIYLTQKNITLAKEYYQLALAQLPSDSRLKTQIQIKLDDLN